jgi:hypothetical protein
MKDITSIDNKIAAVGKLVAELQINQKGTNLFRRF